MGITKNLGTRKTPPLSTARFPSADAAVLERAVARIRESKIDILLVNPPAPDGGIWIRSQHRVGRRSRENMIWPQVSLAQLGALLSPDYSIEIVDAIALRMSWEEFTKLLHDRQARYYLTQIAAPTLTNDMYGVFLAKSLRAVTIGFGTHVTPMGSETLHAYPALDFVLRGEPEASLRELIDTFEKARGRWSIQENQHLIRSGEAGGAGSACPHVEDLEFRSSRLAACLGYPGGGKIACKDPQGVHLPNGQPVEGHPRTGLAVPG